MSKQFSVRLTNEQQKQLLDLLEHYNAASPVGVTHADVFRLAIADLHKKISGGSSK